MVLGITYRDYISFVKGFVKAGSKEYRDRTNAGALSAWPTSEKQIEVFYIMHSAADNFGKLKGVGMELTKKKNQELIVKTTTATRQASVQESCDMAGLKRECWDDDKRRWRREKLGKK